MYDYEWLGYGLIIHFPGGGTMFLHGDAGRALYALLEEITEKSVIASRMISCARKAREINGYGEEHAISKAFRLDSGIA